MKAAKQGNTYAQCDLGIMYALGVAVNSNMEEATKWLQMSAKQGHQGAIELLKNILE